MLVETLTNTQPLVPPGNSQGIVRTARTSGRRQIVYVITLAFSTDPVARWVYPNPQQYLEYFPNFIRLFGGKAFQTGSAYYIDSFSAASLWLPPNVHSDEEGLISLFKTTVSKQIQDDLFGVFEQMGRYHPEEPHWYLPLIGTDPMQQNKGFGAALLKHALKVCDRENKLAYLESSNPQNISLYQRHGFESLGIIQVGSSPPLFPMLRQPQRKVSDFNGLEA